MLDVESRRAYPLLSKQLKRKKKKERNQKPKGKRKIPKGSKNKNSSELRLEGLFRVVNWYFKIIRKVIKLLQLRYFVYDGAYASQEYFLPYGHGNIKKRRIHNFANLSMFMNNLSYLIHKESGFTNYSVNDLKSFFMAEKYTREILKYYGEKVDDILTDLTH